MAGSEKLWQLSLCQLPLCHFPLCQLPLCQLPLCHFPLCQLPLFANCPSANCPSAICPSLPIAPLPIAPLPIAPQICQLPLCQFPICLLVFPIRYIPIPEYRYSGLQISRYFPVLRTSKIATFDQIGEYSPNLLRIYLQTSLILAYFSKNTGFWSFGVLLKSSQFHYF
jgi:hypothetical protein